MKITRYEKIHYYENIIDNPYLLIKNIEDTDNILNETTSITRWKKWIASDGKDEFGYQKFIHHSIIDEKNETLLYINNKIRNAIIESSKNYSEYHNIDLGYLTPLSIAKYSTGGQMGPHVDSYGDDRSPVLSIVLYLNDDYEGGELYFKEQDILIKPTAGSLVAFPSVIPYYHQSKIVTKGFKYMSPGFWYKH